MSNSQNQQNTHNKDHQNQNKPLIGISSGDVNGVGPEVVIKTLSDNRILNYCTPVVYISAKVANYFAKVLNYKNLNFYQIDSVDKAHAERINLKNPWNENPRIEMGKATELSGKYAFQSLSTMMEDLKAGKLNGIVTNPINKKVIQANNFDFPGHTEYLQQETNADDHLMLMASEDIKIGVATGHISFKEVTSHLSKELIVNKLKVLDWSLKQDFTFHKPKIAVLGLNPHAGEEGLLGNEEDEMIAPAIEAAKEENLLAFGPYPADGFFGSRQFMNFDATLAMYHDQGLVPFKTLSFEKGVNYTAGLPCVRTSPDHGTGFAISGKNQAHATSLREALFMNIDIIKNRGMHDVITANPLESRMVKEKET